MDEKFRALLSIVIVPQVIELILEKDRVNEVEAIDEFYHSKVYELLSIEDTKIWHYSPLTIYNMYRSEKDTGEIEFPEGI